MIFLEIVQQFHLISKLSIFFPSPVVSRLFVKKGRYILVPEDVELDVL